MQKKFLMTAASIVLLCLGGMASAATATWTGDYNNDFMQQYNWTSQLAPAAGDTLTISAGSYYNPVFNGTGTTTTGLVSMNAGASLVVSSGNLRFAGLTDTSLNVQSGPGVLINGGTLTCSKNIYLGRNSAGDNTTMTVTSGALISGSTVTVGYASNNVALNLWGGANDLGTLPRINHSGGTGCYIDIRSPGTALINDTTGNPNLTTVQTMIANGLIVSGPGEEPNAIAVFNPPTDANFPHVLLRTIPVYYAVSPSPISATTAVHVVAQTGQVLSWVNPLPRNPGDTVTSTVYFGVGSPTTMVASGITGTSVTVNTVPQTTYFWRVDSTDTNGGSPITTTGKVWTFDTIIAPTMALGYSGRQAAFRGVTDPNATITLRATATDADNAPGTLLYGWASNDEPNTVWSDTTVLNPSVRFVVPTHDYTLTLTVNDGANTATGTMTVRVFDAGDYCNAAKFPTSFAYLTGDFTQDCVVDMKDMAKLVENWLVCNSPDCI